MFIWFCSKFIQETTNQISSELPEFYRRYYKKHFGLFISGHSVFILQVLSQPHLSASEHVLVGRM